MPQRPPAFDPRSEARGEHLKTLLSQADNHTSQEKVVLEAIPEDLRDQCRFGGFEEGELTLITEAATTASLLRFRQHEILTTLREHSDTFRYVWRMRVKVRPQPARTEKPLRHREISKENARLLEEEAGHTKDQGLKQVLEKLARHTRHDDS